MICKNIQQLTGVSIIYVDIEVTEDRQPRRVGSKTFWHVIEVIKKRVRHTARPRSVENNDDGIKSSTIKERSNHLKRR